MTLAAGMFSCARPVPVRSVPRNQDADQLPRSIWCYQIRSVFNNPHSVESKQTTQKVNSQEGPHREPSQVLLWLTRGSEFRLDTSLARANMPSALARRACCRTRSS
eukprot:3322462-Prymnesium_polylepis.1